MGDQHDFAILQQVQANPLGGPTVWAKEAGIDSSALRRRLKVLEKRGVLQGFVATPTAEALGRKQVPHQFHCTQVDMDKIMAIDDVAWAAATLDGRVFVNTFETQDSRRSELEQLLGPNVATFDDVNHPPATTLGRITLKVLRALIIHPRASNAELTRETKLSTKTVAKHRELLMQNNYLRIDPILRPPTDAGRLFYHISFSAENESRRDEVIAQLQEVMVVSLFKDPPAAYLFCSAANIEAQARQQAYLKSLPGISDVQLLINTDYALAQARLIKWCDELIEKWSASQLAH